MIVLALLAVVGVTTSLELLWLYHDRDCRLEILIRCASHFALSDDGRRKSSFLMHVTRMSLRIAEHRSSGPLISQSILERLAPHNHCPEELKVGDEELRRLLQERARIRQ
jgi:hypothetical protein